MKVPGDLSLIGFDDHEMAEYADLTTVQQPIKEESHLAAARLNPATHNNERDTPTPHPGCG